jgi:crotonobetainyl-CoA:carnitine CoA-transferase CaiB-like acyl-CoA transferase
MTDRRVPLPARTDASGLAAAAIAAVSSAAARRARAEPTLGDAGRTAVAYSSERWFRVDGNPPVAFAPLSGFFEASDGWVRTHANYPHHATALRSALDLDEAADRDAVATALARLPADDASDRIVAAGGLCVTVRPEDPARDAELRGTPLVSTMLLGDAPRRALRPPDAAAPLRGIRVLDLTRVIAGPVATRTLAFLGADVLRIDPPRLPEPEWQHLDSGHGKRSTLLDLADAAQRARFDELLSTADVVVLGYRPAGLARLGLSPGELAAARPGLVIGRLTAWGTADRRGFDSLVQAESGIAWIEQRDGAPGALPAQALDHSAGYLLAAGIIDALEEQSADGGTRLVETSLRRVAAELLGMPRTSDPEPLAGPDPNGHLQTFDVDGMEVVTTAPAVAYAGSPIAFAAPRPWGRDDPAWPAPSA